MLNTINGKLANHFRKVDYSYVLATYKSKNGSWRGFVHPYDITIEADTKEKAVKALEDMVIAYEEGLAAHGSPSHLARKVLSDDEDRDFFHNLTIEALSGKGKIDEENFYAQAKKVSA